MLANTLNTNEIKDSTGAEVEFQHLDFPSGRSRRFAKIGEVPYLPHRVTISHLETGAGLKKRRRSVVRVDKTVVSGVDSVTPITVSVYVVADLPVGAQTSGAENAHAMAELLSFCASLGASTTILYDGTGNGATSLLNGSL